ncbi:diguanylate phosphodiesterase [Lottiidibacillus patelloidae]|uniref:Diguanylate phosphodiesterase n=1 Tax=Lottiidibacillus patelloidae TaxID=2670334 RepID=A0A263BT74_9BACI|nr:EAL domain-containing protein [Lottiidibacillus patelloidae]OZM56931.1 diguanylate phosphodiesterase [Lottiidibacillus patelloidae]
MNCSSCIVMDVLFEIKMEGEANLSLLNDVILHLNREHGIVKFDDNILTIKEASVREFVYFCNDHMEPEMVYFRIDNEDWKPIKQINAVIDVQWIDEIIIKELVTCYYQPIVNGNEEIYAYELLARFQHEDGSTLYPNEVFAAAKERGRLYALDRLCRMNAVKAAARIDKKAFINFIPTSIYSPEHCLKSTVALANKLNVDPSELVFEVVETEKVNDIDHLKKILAYYNEKGFKYALDDVGEGFSTTEVLADLKPHYMKLDRQYVNGVANDITKQKNALSFLEHALMNGSTPLAEGIEVKEDFEWLQTKGYQLFQGYLFGKPSPTPIKHTKKV